MKYNLLLSISILTYILIVSSCSNPQKLYDKGNYEKAFSKALGNLKKGKKNRSDLRLLNDSFEKIMEEDIKDITRLKKASLQDKENAYKRYGKLFDIYEEGRAFIDSELEDRVDVLYDDSASLAAFLSDTYSDTASRKLNQAQINENKLDAQTAFYQFNKAIFYDKKDQYLLDSLREIALQLGTVYYEVERVSFDFDLAWEIDRVFDDIENDIRADFVVVNYGLEGERPDCKIDLSFSDLSQYDQSDVDSRDFEEQVITGYNTEVDTSGNKTETPIYDEVSGTVRINRVRRNTELALIADLDSYSNACNFDDGRLKETFYEEREFYEIYGDERAIPDKYKSNNVDEFSDPKDIAEDLIQELYRDFKRMFN